MTKAKLVSITLMTIIVLGGHSSVTGAPASASATAASVANTFEREKLFGEPVYDAAGKLQYVVENKSQTHSKDQFVMVRVKGFKIRPVAQEIGRIRIAVWDSADTYGKEGVKPFRSSSHWAKEAVNNEMLFKIGGLELGKSYAFFAHFDKDNSGSVRRVLGIPVEPYIFTNAKTKGQGAGLKREGLSPPKFESTLVKYTGPGQEVVLTF